MTRIVQRTMECWICGHGMETSDLASMYIRGPIYPDLDTRPGNADFIMRYWINKCPVCGYAAPDISEPTMIQARHIKKVTTGQKYQRIVGVENNWLSEAFFTHAMLMEEMRKKMEAFYGFLHASWACEDRRAERAMQVEALRILESGIIVVAEKLADEARRDPFYSIRRLFVNKYERSENDEERQEQLEKPENLRLIQIDLLRMTGQFNKAMEKCGEAKLRNENHQKILAFEKGLIRRRDNRRHSTHDVFGGPEPSVY